LKAGAQKKIVLGPARNKLITFELNSWQARCNMYIDWRPMQSRVLQDITVAQLLIKLPVFYGIQMFGYADCWVI
jgi:hypothetical protein